MLLCLLIKIFNFRKSGAKKVLDLGQCGDFTLLAKQELRGINSKAVYARKEKYYVDIKTGSYKFGWKELKYLGLVGFWVGGW